MKQTLKVRVLSAVTAVATVGSILLSTAAVQAGTPTTMTDMMSREAVTTASTHDIYLTGIASGDWANAETIILTFEDFTDFGATNPDCLASTGGTCAASSTSPNILTLTCTGTCTGTVSVSSSGFLPTNPASTGSKTVTLSGTSDVTGSFAVPIVDNDQVTVSAAVDPTITFDIDTSVTTHSENGPTYTVDLGTLTSNS
ncbi:MAG: hypothetical protein ABH861_04865, partial [Patescibacteria group bacterium]